MAHTPTPWKWDGEQLWHVGESYESAQDSHRYVGINADPKLSGSQTLKDNKDYTLRAVNAFEPLVEALKQSDKLLVKLLCLVNTPAIQDHLPYGLKDEVTAAVAKDSIGIDAALALADKEQP